MIFIGLIICSAAFSQKVQQFSLQTPNGNDTVLCFHYDLTRFKDEIKAFSKDTAGEHTVFFIGSSSIRKWKSLPDDLKPLQAVNRGFGGATLGEVLYYRNELIFDPKPEKIVLYAGENDISAENMTVEQVFQLYKLLVDLIHAKMPDVSVMYLSQKPSPARYSDWPDFKKLNKMISDHASGHPYLHYLDISKLMLDKNEQVIKDIFLPDRLHLNRNGYDLWKNYLSRELMKTEQEGSS